MRWTDFGVLPQQFDDHLFEVFSLQRGIKDIDPIGYFMAMGRQAIDFIRSGVVLLDVGSPFPSVTNEFFQGAREIDSTCFRR